MVYRTLTLEKDAGVGVLTINRPPMNPLNSLFFTELEQVAAEVGRDPDVRVLIITGAGEKSFAAGADITEMVNLTPLEMYDFCHRSLAAFSRLESLDKPTIAAVNGLALGGGCELALVCDFRLAAETARFGLPEINLGIIPGGGGTQRLPRLIGAARAKELLFLGEMIDAATAQAYGLVHRVVPGNELPSEARKLAEKLLARPAVAQRVLKTAVNSGMNMDLSSALLFELESFLITFASEDRVEGFNALLEKRKPNFKGR